MKSRLTYEIEATAEAHKRVAVGAPPLHNGHDSSREGDQEAAETEERWVTQTLCEIALGLTWLEEQSLILLLGQGVGDLPAQVVSVDVRVHLRQLLAVVAVLVMVCSHYCV
jgi:hypothetical protein